MAIIEGTGIKAAGSEAQKKAKKVAEVYYGGAEAENRRRLKNFLNEFDRRSPLGGGEGGTIKIPDMVPIRKASLKGDETFKKKTFFSPDGGAFDKRNNVKLASADLSNFEASGFTDDEVGSDTSTFGASFTKQADANLADASVYRKKEDNIYRPTDNVYDSIKSPKIEKDTGYGASLEKGIDNLDSFNRSFYGVDKATKEYGVPMSKEEKRVTTAYALTNPDESFKDAYKFSDTNYEKIKSDYAKYQNLRDRRQTRKEAEEAVTKFRKDYMKDFEDADYAIKMKRYNKDGTEHNLNKYILSRDEYAERLRTDLRDYNEITARYGEGVNNAMDRYGNLMTSEEKRKFEKKVAAE